MAAPSSSPADVISNAAAGTKSVREISPLYIIERSWPPLADKPVAELGTAEFINACRVLVPLYDLIFSAGGTVSNILKKDIVDHLNEIETVYKADPVANDKLLTCIENEIRALGREAKALRTGSTATRGLLWVLRTLDFIAHFMSGMADPLYAGKNPADVARGAYTLVLKPYHGWLISNVVRMALGVVPSRERLIVNFGFPSEEAARDDINNVARFLRPVIDNLYVWMRQNRLDFPDKVGV